MIGTKIGGKIIWKNEPEDGNHPLKLVTIQWDLTHPILSILNGLVPIMKHFMLNIPKHQKFFHFWWILWEIWPLEQGSHSFWDALYIISYYLQCIPLWLWDTKMKWRYLTLLRTQPTANISWRPCSCPGWGGTGRQHAVTSEDAWSSSASRWCNKNYHNSVGEQTEGDPLN